MPLMFFCGEKKEGLRDNDVGRYQLLEIRTESDKTYCNRKREVRDKFDTKTGRQN